MADAERKLREILNIVLTEKKYIPREIEIKLISTGGANYTSALFNVGVQLVNRADLKLFAKVASIGEVMRAYMNADWLFTTERRVYTKLVKIYSDIEIKNNVPYEHRYCFPKFFGCDAELGRETIIMENLVENGYRIYDRLETMDWEHASIAMENLAKFHALSFAFDEYYPEEFYRLTLDMQFRGFQEERETDDEFNAYWMRMVEDSLEVLDEEKREPVRTFASDIKVMNIYNKPIGRKVLSHGDYRLSNLLFKKENGILQTIAVDYQTVHAGCPAGDIVYFIFMGSDEEFRLQYYEKLKDHYYINLGKALERLSVDPSVYPRDKFESDMKKVLPIAVLVGIFILPMITIDAESVPKVNGNVGIADFVVKPNELYAQRFRGIVNDCIKWGAL